MEKEFLEIAQIAINENWDAFKIMAHFTSLQKERDAVLAESVGQYELAKKIRE